MREHALSPLLSMPLPEPADAKLDWQRFVERFRWMQTLAGVPQDPVHHAEGDVAVHTRMVAEAMVGLSSWQSLAEGERAITLAAAVFHDIAKPATTRCEDDGRITARGHSGLGERMARAELWRMGVPFGVREAIAAMVRFHQQPFFLVERDDTQRQAARISWSTRCDHLGLLAEADIRGRISPDQAKVLDAIAMFRMWCDDDGCLTAPRSFANDTARFEYFQRDDRDPDYVAWEGETFEVTLMSGLPASGKDHYIATHAAGLPVVSLDALRAVSGVDSEDNQGTIVQAAEAKAREHLRARRPFVWNATNLTRQRRAPLITLFARYGARVRVVHVEAPEAVMRAANRARPADRRVPERVLDAMIAKWEVPDATEAHTVEYVVRDSA